MVALLALLVMATIAPPAAAEWEARYVQHSLVDIDGFKGYQGIRTDPATVTNVGYVHPAQIDVGGLAGDFVAIGTSNGAPPAVPTNCANDYDPYWTVYTDGIIGGLYFCTDERLDYYTSGSNPSFQITWGSCGGNKWVLQFGGPTWACITSSSSSGSAVIAGLETTGASTVDRNIDVKYTGLYRSRTNSSSWEAFGTGTAIHDPYYSYQYVSSTAFNVYLAPLD